MPTTVRSTILEVRLTPQSGPDAGTPVLDPTAYAATCSFGFDQRYAEATIRRTGGGTIPISYWDEVELRMGATPGEGAGLRFKGYVIPVQNRLYPVEGTLLCRGYLYRAAWVKNLEPGGTRMADLATGTADEAQVMAVLDACAVPYSATNIAGTGKPLGLHSVDTQNPLAPNPFVWGEGQAGLDYIEQLDPISVPDAATGAYRTFESLGGDVFRILVVTAPDAAADFTFTEGVDVLEASITRDPTGAANRVTVSGGPDPANATLMPGDPTDVNVAFTATARYTATNPDAPYLPPALPVGPDGYRVVAAAFASPMIEKSLRADPHVTEDVQSCQNVADYLLGESNAVVDTLEFSTPRDDLLGPGQTIHLTSDRLALTDPDRHYWLQHLDVEVDERGAFTQRLRCVRRS
jgi:hypothetical protein